MKRSAMALIADESEDVVFEERECSLDLLHTFRSPEAIAESMSIIDANNIAKSMKENL